MKLEKAYEIHIEKQNLSRINYISKKIEKEITHHYITMIQIMIVIGISLYSVFRKLH